eukprot:g48325.t1
MVNGLKVGILLFKNLRDLLARWRSPEQQPILGSRTHLCASHLLNADSRDPFQLVPETHSTWFQKPIPASSRDPFQLMPETHFSYARDPFQLVPEIHSS